MKKIKKYIYNKILKNSIIILVILITITNVFIGNIVYAVDSENFAVNNIENSGNNTETESTGGAVEESVDVAAGTILEPLLAFVRYIADTIMSAVTSFMTNEPFTGIMTKNPVNYENTNISATKTLDMEPYKNVFGFYTNYKYPNFKYSLEHIFTGKVDLLSIDFLSGKVVGEDGIRDNNSEGWNRVRSIISAWYKILRMFSMVGLLSVLIYTGIKIIISANAQDKAKYKERIVNWFIAVALLFAMHYIMAFIIAVVQNITLLFGNTVGTIKVNLLDGRGTTFVTNLMGLARFQAQQMAFTTQVVYIAIYIALVTITIRFTLVYIKRMINMAFLTLIAPIVALTYPIDKMKGEARGFQLWLKDYIYNALLQLLHYILYVVLLESSLDLAVTNPIYAIIVLMFMTQAEKLMKKIFGFQRARGGTVGGLAGAFTATAFVTGVTHMFQGNNSKKSLKANDIRYKNDLDYLDLLKKDDANVGEFINENLLSGLVVESEQEPESNRLQIDNSIYNKRKELTDEDLTFNKNGDNRDKYLDGIFRDLTRQYGKIERAENNQNEIDKFMKEIEKNRKKLEHVIINNEAIFGRENIPFQYADIYSNLSSKELLDKMNESLEVGDYEKAKEYYDILNRRRKENEYFSRNGGPQLFIKPVSNTANDTQQPTTINLNLQQQTQNRQMPSQQQTQNRQMSSQYQIPNGQVSNQQQVQGQQPVRRQILNNDMPGSDEKIGLIQEAMNTPLAMGLRNVGRKIAKPVWDTQKDARYNGERLAKNLSVAAVGAVLGTTAAAVQAGISISDGKYNPIEGVASFASGVAVANKIVKGVTEDEVETLKNKANEWYNDDNVINKYNSIYGNKGKSMRDRARKNYISRGISDFEEQRQIFEYAEYLLAQHRVSSIDEADRLAIAVYEYRKDLIENGTYASVIDNKKKEKYLDFQVKRYNGSASEQVVRKTHENFIKSAIEFDNVVN